jgi:hypothetical protein
MEEVTLPSITWYTDLPKNVREFPYDHYCLIYEVRGNRIVHFDGINFFERPRDWKKVSWEGHSLRVIFARELRSYHQIWTLPTGLRFGAGPRTQKELRDRLIGRKLKLRKQLTGHGITSWELLDSVLKKT